MAAAACSTGANPSAISTGPSPASSAGYLTYVDSSAGFRISYPPTWTQQSIGTGKGIAFVSPAAGASDDFRENVNVVVEDLPDPSISLDQYTSASLRQLRTAVDGFKLLTSGTTTVADRSAERVTYLGNLNRDLKFEEIWVVERGRSYVLTYTATPDAFAGTESTAEAIIDSFQLG